MDFTSAVYSLIVLTSATLAILQYLKNTISEEITAATERLEDEWENGKFQPIRLKKDALNDPSIVDQYKEIVNIAPHFDQKPMRWMFTLLPICGVLQILNIFAKINDFSYSSTIWIGYFVAIFYCIQIGLILWAGRRVYILIQSRNRVLKLREDWEPLAEATMNGMANNWDA